MRSPWRLRPQLSFSEAALQAQAGSHAARAPLCTSAALARPREAERACAADSNQGNQARQAGVAGM